MKNSSGTIGNRTRDLLACSTVPQPTAPPCTPCYFRQQRKHEISDLHRSAVDVFDLNVTGRRLILGCQHLYVSRKQIDPILKIQADHSSLTTGALKM
jgi:hypothetical protein